VAKKLIDRYKWWEWYCRGIDAMDNNPAPGNKAGGITTVFEKSLGGVTKGGTTPMMDVFQYGEPITTRGFVFMDTPGHDPVSITGLVAGGCNVICFTTGRGSVFGCKPVPSIKLATNSLMYRHMVEDMDLNCGVVLEGTPIATVGRQIFEEVIAVASGKGSKSELSGGGGGGLAPGMMGAGRWLRGSAGRSCSSGLDDGDDEADGGEDVADPDALRLGADLDHRLAGVVDLPGDLPALGLAAADRLLKLLHDLLERVTIAVLQDRHRTP